jgi:rhamnosyltransferase
MPILAPHSSSVGGSAAVVGARPSASVVIRTYNEAKLLPDVLQALSVQVHPGGAGAACEVIVVDSGSTDGTPDIAAAAGATVLNISKDEFTYGRALNRGCEAAKAEFLVFLSGHCIPAGSNWLSNLLQPFNDPHVAITYGRQVAGRGTKFSEARVFAKYYPDGAPSQGSAFCNNANCAVRKSIWRRFRYDESLSGLEDLALGKQVQRAGFRCDYVSAAAVHHIHDESWGQIRRRYERESIALRHIFPELHFHLFDAAKCFFAAVSSDVTAKLGRGSGSGRISEIVRYRFNQFYGSWLGHRSHRELSEKEKYRYFFPS